MRIITRILAVFLIGTIQVHVHGQCSETFAKVLGSVSSSERGYSIVASESTGALYAGATINDSLAIIKLNSTGSILWTRKFDIAKGKPVNINGMILDAEGKIGIAGSIGDIDEQGNAFVCRYDPEMNILLWSHEFLSTSMGFCSGIIEMGAGGNYLLSHNPALPNNAALILLDKQTGAIQNGFSKHYHLGSSETIGDMVLYKGALYGTGRFSDGPSEAQMRTTLISLNPNDGTPEWVKLGHRPISIDARLYGVDLVIDNNQIYFVSLGDEDGTSVDVTKIYVQKANLDGNISWVKQYELPGANDWVDEIIESDNGFVILARNRKAPSDIILFKIDHEGQVLWARKFDYATNDNSVTLGGITSQMVTLGNYIYFTAYAEGSGQPDIILVKINLDGEISESCMASSSIDIAVRDIPNQVFYSVQPEVFNFIPQVVELGISVGQEIPLSEVNVCGGATNITTHIEANICDGEEYEGYGQSGIYLDTFPISTGCDSVRALHLTVNTCHPECGTIIGSIYGSPNENERGYCLVATPENDGMYVAGIKEDSLLVIKMNPEGAVEWSRTFDIIPDQEEYPYSIILDSEGMLAISGTVDEMSVGGIVFILRYDPQNHQILWTNEYISSPNTVQDCIIQKGAGGNYLMVNDLNFHSQDHIDVEILEIDKNTGMVIPSFSKGYRLTDRETLLQIVYDGHFIYGTGRYKQGNINENFRNTLVKLNPDDGTQVWTKMGHIPNNTIARLYGSHLLIDQNAIISGSYGDPSGTSVTNTNLYLQKTSLDGDIIWFKQYELSGTNAYCYGIIKSGNGYVILSGKRSPQTELVMFKIDFDGNALWAKTFQYSSMIDEARITPTIGGRGQTKIIEVGHNLVFIGHGINPSGGTDMLLVRTDLDGEVDLPCVKSQDFALTVNVIDPVFFSVSPEEYTVNPEVNSISPQSIETNIKPREECVKADTIFSSVTATICEGETYEGYSSTGIYVDIFITPTGCDSIRTLNLTVEPHVQSVIEKDICKGNSYEGYSQSGIYIDTFSVSTGCDSIRILRLNVISCLPVVAFDLNGCSSYMIDGSHMDYTEFIPSYPNTLSCAEVTAGFLFREPLQTNKHSCTPGIGDSPAMCVTTFNSCTYVAGQEASVVIEVTISPAVDSVVRLTGLDFFEKSPSTYAWIDGPSGPNNYPRFYGIRILRNGMEIFQQTGIQTTTSWTLQSFDFIDEDLFLVDETTEFRIELLPYCPIGNGAVVSAWDLDEFKIYAGCIHELEVSPVIKGVVSTNEQHAIENVVMYLANHSDFSLSSNKSTDEKGYYLFDSLNKGGYFLKGYKNDEVLNGISTLDLIKIQKHLLGIEPFTTLDQYIAADVNHSGNISVMDLIELRKLLLGRYTEFPGNTSWRFGKLPQSFSGTDISSFKEIWDIEYLERDTQTVNFLGIKIGDLNGDVQLEGNSMLIETRNVKTYSFLIEDKEVKEGIPFLIDVRANDHASIEGFQIGFGLWDLEVISVTSDRIPLTMEHVYFTEDGILRMSWNQHEPVSVSPGDVLFSVTLIARNSGSLAKSFQIDPKLLNPEIYTSTDIDPIPLRIKLVQPSISEAGNFFFKIEPNPFQSIANLRFYLVEGGNVVFQFYDVSGRILHVIDKNYTPGEHIEQVTDNDFPRMTGTILCQMISNEYTGIQKFIRMD